jgi:hypothetical protein
MEQQRDHHRRLVRRAPMAVAAISAIERRRAQSRTNGAVRASDAGFDQDPLQPRRACCEAVDDRPRGLGVVAITSCQDTRPQVVASVSASRRRLWRAVVVDVRERGSGGWTAGHGDVCAPGCREARPQRVAEVA